MNASEINSSFHRPHRRSTYERWASVVPDEFAFSVKIPKTVSHEKRCDDCEAELERFLAESSALGVKRRLLLLQLPPSFAFDEERMERFFVLCRQLAAPRIVCEPRHPSWFGDAADALLTAFQVARVAADPARVSAAGKPGGWAGLEYYRMHGSPRTYYSSYSDETLATLADTIAAAPCETWCIFDNTASGAALSDAIRLSTSLSSRQRASEL